MFFFLLLIQKALPPADLLTWLSTDLGTDASPAPIVIWYFENVSFISFLFKIQVYVSLAVLDMFLVICRYSFVLAHHWPLFELIAPPPDFGFFLLLCDTMEGRKDLQARDDVVASARQREAGEQHPQRALLSLYSGHKMS